jgi:class 3 adenylate cyclase
LEIEQERSERLLLNILPAAIAEQLKDGHKVLADTFNNVTVLFADIVDFTPLAYQLRPNELVALLNNIFSTFDRLAEQHGLEKIKTIGDAYMVVGGLPTEREDHTEAVASMALAMQEAISQFNRANERPFEMRIGIDTGPVVAGVIGTKKFAYDLWGDTVNTASRMESHGLAGAIQVTYKTYEKLRDKYNFEHRGPIEVKGKGTTQAYILINKKE